MTNKNKKSKTNLLVLGVISLLVLVLVYITPSSLDVYAHTYTNDANPPEDCYDIDPPDPENPDMHACFSQCVADVCDELNSCGDPNSNYDPTDQSCGCTGDSCQTLCPDGVTIDDGNGSCDDSCSDDPCGEDTCGDGGLPANDPICDNTCSDDPCGEDTCGDGGLPPDDPLCDNTCSDDPCGEDTCGDGGLPANDPICDPFGGGAGGGAGASCSAGSFVQDDYGSDCPNVPTDENGQVQTTQFVCASTPEYNQIYSATTSVTVSGDLGYIIGPYAFHVRAYPAVGQQYGNAERQYDGNNTSRPPFSLGPVGIPYSSTEVGSHQINIVVSGGFEIYCKISDSSDCNAFSANPNPDQYVQNGTCNVTTWGHIPYILSDEEPVEPPIEPDPPIVEPPVDWCDNIDAVQDRVPDGYYRQGESCFINNPGAVGKCGSANGQTIEEGSVTVGGYMSGQCKAGAATPIEEDTNSGGDPIYTWKCTGGGGNASCSALVDQCADGGCEMSVCGSAEDVTYDPNSNPGYNVGSAIGDNQDPACEVPDQTSETITSISADADGEGTIFWTCGSASGALNCGQVTGQSIGCCAPQEACPNGKSYCATDNQCWPPGSSDNPCSIIDAPDIDLNVSPLINFNGTCEVGWTLLDPPNSRTICRIFNVDKPNTEYISEFTPSGTTGSQSFSNIKTDSRYKMECGQTNKANSTTTATGVCRINFKAGEFN